MLTENAKNKILVIVGPTGSGKTSLGVELALRFDGEIISADSRAIYKGMDIGTAKPTLEEQKGVPHFGIDLVEPDEKFTVYDFQQYAQEKIKEIQGRRHLPIIVGGTGLYVDALVYGYSFTEESKQNYTDREKMLDGFEVFGIKMDKGVLRERLRKRIDIMFEQGIEEETEKLFIRYDHRRQALRSDIYPIVWRYLQGEISREEAKEQAFYKDWNLARRQMTWFRRNKEIKWMNTNDIISML